MTDSAAWLDRLERASAHLARRLERDPSPTVITQGLVDELGVELAQLWLSDPGVGTLRLAASARRGVVPSRYDTAMMTSDARSLVMEALRQHKPIIRDGRHAKQRDAARGQPQPATVQTYAAVPLVVGNEPCGALLLGQTVDFSPAAVAALTVLARQLALVLAQARVVAETRTAREASARQLERLSALTQITHELLAAEELDAVVQIVAESASRLCDAAGAMVELIDDDRRHLIVLAAYGEPETFFDQFHVSQLTDSFYAETAAGQALLRRRTVVVENYATWRSTYELKQQALSLGVQAIIAAPLLVDGAPIGVLWVCDVMARSFAAEDIALVEALADQAALAIQHTRLRARSEEAAVLEERARLARDLHDSATQSVFSTQMMANAALLQYERGAPGLADTLARLRTIAQDALSELRALLYELRPTALEEEGLAKALAKLVAAMQVRVEIPISYAAISSARLEREAEHAIFRIVQEALANATKYAQATRITVLVTEQDQQLTVTVSDDGVGFDPAGPAVPSQDSRRGGLGLRSMRERAVAAGLRLRVESAPGAGCQVIVEAPVKVDGRC